jgi:SNF2 family DNA or RNA helicase
MKALFEFEKSRLNSLQKTILETIEADGLAIETDDLFWLTHDQSIKLNEVDRSILEIPKRPSYLIFLGAISTLNQEDFKFTLSFRKHFSSEDETYQTDGTFITINSQKFLPDHSQNRVLTIIKEFQQQGSHSFEDNLKALGKIKSQCRKLIEEGKLVFDKYLDSENVEFADKLRLDFLENPDGSVNVVPSIGHKSDEGFKKSFDLYPKVKGVYNTQDEGNRLRVVIPDSIKDSLLPLKSEFRKIGGEKKDKVLKNPSNYFDESLFDLDHYSKRVYELGYYEPKYYPFIRPFSTDWVSGITIEEASGERVELLLENDKEFEELNAQIKQAETENLDSVNFKEKKIPIGDAVSLRDSYQAIKEKRVDKNGFRDSNGKKVLIIHENVEGIDFSIEAQKEIDHLFIAPKRLKPEYKLLPHQVEGTAWLQSLSKSNSGALLGDDMGLGKTLQILSFLDWSHDYQEEIGSNKPNLVVAPVTLLENWENEFSRFFEPFLSFIRYYGKEAKDIDLFTLGRKDVILTTYETLRSKQLLVGRINWYSTILDEAQRIKTPGTMVTNAAKALNAEFKIAMTGTPVENSWMDLWCLTDFIAPGLLGSAKEFNNKYNQSLVDENVDLKSLGDDIRGQLGVYLKRRIKSQILKDLPEKNLKFLPSNMPNIQKSRYLEELENYQKNKGSMNQILTTISKLRMISDHPFLDQDPEELNSYLTEELIQASAKMIETISILERIKEKGEKAILFTHFEKVQSILSRMVIEYFGIPVSIINGQTATIESKGKESRQKLIDRFQSIQGFNVIIMSPIAAGYGLNVTEANHVIHYTRHWNPAKENQATDRVYRIGQKKDVHIYYPMATIEGRETFDQKLDGLLRMKTQLSDASLYPSESAEVKFSEFEDLLN